MNLQPFSFKGAEVRTVTQSNEPWFVATDVCSALEIVNTSDALNGLDRDEQAGIDITDTSSTGITQRRTVLCINEPGLYSLVLRSRKPEAKAFKRWITHEVLPAIRRTGEYAVSKIPTLEETLETALRLVRENKQLALKNEELAPKAAYFDAVASSGDTHLIREAAKLLKGEWGEKKLFRKLREIGYLMKNNEPYQEYVNRGYFTFTQSSHTSPRSGKVYLTVTPRITGKGMTHLHSILN